MNIEDVNQLLEPGYLPMETGFTRLPNNDVYIAVLTRMPRCKGKMIDWWFGYAGDTEKYKWWPRMTISLGTGMNTGDPGIMLGPAIWCMNTLVM